MLDQRDVGERWPLALTICQFIISSVRKARMKHNGSREEGKIDSAWSRVGEGYQRQRKGGILEG